METFGERLKRLRKDRGLSVQKVADRLQVTHSIIDRAEHDEHMIRAKRLEPLARLLGVSIDYLLTGREIPSVAALHRAIHASVPHRELVLMIDRQRQ